MKRVDLVLVLFHLLLLPSLCHANTEIITFSPSREPRVDLGPDTLGNGTLRPSDNEREWSLTLCDDDACPHALWLYLDLDDDDDERWARSSTFTLRLSWPASVPAEVEMTMYSPQEAARLVGVDKALASSSSTTHAPTTRARYARIRAIDTGVPTPHHAHSHSHSPHHAHADTSMTHHAVPLVILLEPVHGGILPASVLPTVGLLIPITLAAAVCVVPLVMAYVDPFVRQAREDGMRLASKAR